MDMNIRYQDLLNGEEINRHIDTRVEKDSSLFTRVEFQESIADDLDTQRDINYYKKQLVLYAKVGNYSRAAGKFINYCVRLNIPEEAFKKVIKSEYYRNQYIYFLKKKQATIEFIQDILPKLNGLNNYIALISKSPEKIEPNKSKLIKAQKEHRQLMKRVKPVKGILNWIRWEYHGSIYYPNNRFSLNNTLNSILVYQTKELLKAEEEWLEKWLKPLFTLESIAFTYKKSKGSFEVFSQSMLKLFLWLIQQYIREYHQNDLKAENKARKRKNDKVYYNNHRESRLATKDERRTVVLYLWHHLRKTTFQGIEEKLVNTKWKTSRKTVAVWIKKFYTVEDVVISDSLLGELSECVNFSGQ